MFAGSDTAWQPQEWCSMTIAESPNRAAPGDALDRVLADPEVRAALAVIVANAPQMARIVETSTALQALDRSLPTRHEQSLLPERQWTTQESAQVWDYSDVLWIFGYCAHAFERLMDSGLLKSELLGTLSRLDGAAMGEA